MFEFLSKNQQKVAMITGYVVVFMLAFGLGRLTALRQTPPDIRIEEPLDNSQANSNAEIQGVQSQATESPTEDATQKSYPAGFAPVNGSCGGKIKGSSSRIYHFPGGAFYDRTTKPAWCFNTEAEAGAAGFRKSAR